MTSHHDPNSPGNLSGPRPGQPSRERFSAYYALPTAPWDIGRPQRAFVEAGERIGGRGLDCGCGSGDLAIWLAGRGHAVTGVDFLPGPLAVAREKARRAGVAVNFLEMDATAVGTIPERFDAVTDSGLFHSFDDATRAAYIDALRRLLEPGARVFILCMSPAEPGEQGPRRVAEEELRAAFADGFAVESIEPARFEVVPGIAGAEFSPGGAHGLFATLRRV